jgi:polyisoprenoid-binding protein YceI
MRYKAILPVILASLFALGTAFSAEKYDFDLPHSYVGFSVRHLVISNVKGNFTDFSGHVMFDEDDITKSSVEVSIKMASVDTDNEKRDGHLKSADFFNVEKYPAMTFKSKKIEKAENGYVMHGELTMLGVTKEIPVHFEMLGKAKGMQGEDRAGFEGYAKLNRKDFGITWNQTMDAGGLVVGDEVKIELQIELVKM